MKKLLAFTVLVGLLAACGPRAATPDMTEQPLPPPPPDVAQGGDTGNEGIDNSGEFEPALAPPAAYLVSGESLIPGEQGSYCWTPGDGSPGLCADFMWPTQVPPGATFETGQELVIRFEDNPPASASIQLYDADAIANQSSDAEIIDQQDITLQDGDAIWTPDVPPGRYLVSMFTRWPDGNDSSYFFGVEIIAAGSEGETNPGDGIDAADLSPPTIYLLVGGEPRRGSAGGYCWSPVKGDDGEAPPGICADVAVLDVNEYFALSEGENIHFAFDAPHPTTVNVAISQTLAGDVLESLTLQLPGDTVEWAPPLESGDYILTVAAEWEAQGDSLTLFGITWP